MVPPAPAICGGTLAAATRAVQYPTARAPVPSNASLTLLLFERCSRAEEIGFAPPLHRLISLWDTGTPTWQTQSYALKMTGITRQVGLWEPGKCTRGLCIRRETKVGMKAEIQAVFTAAVGKRYFNIDENTPVMVGWDTLPEFVPMRKLRKAAEKEAVS